MAAVRLNVPKKNQENCQWLKKNDLFSGTAGSTGRVWRW